MEAGLPGCSSGALWYLVRGSSSTLALPSSQLLRGALLLRHPPDPLLLHCATHTHRDTQPQQVCYSQLFRWFLVFACATPSAVEASEGGWFSIRPTAAAAAPLTGVYLCLPAERSGPSVLVPLGVCWGRAIGGHG